MKALIAIFSWILGLFSSGDAPVQAKPSVSINTSSEDVLGVHIHNPRTVVALEDTHFNPSR